MSCQFGIAIAAERPYYFAVSVEDLDRAAVWYEKTFDLTRLDDTTADDERWRIVNLRSDELFVEIIFARRDGEAGRNRGIAKVGFSVADVEAVADRVAKRTGERPEIVTSKQHRIHILQLRDPEGNVIQLSSAIVEDSR
jgi:predicted enzyme related to lactoylglutathione lyase